MKDHLTTGQVARAMNVSPDTVRRWIGNGHLIASRMPGDGTPQFRIHVDRARQFAKINSLPFSLDADTIAKLRAAPRR